MSVSLLPSSLYSHLRSQLSALSCASKSLDVSARRGELLACIKLYGRAARLFALQVGAHAVISRDNEQQQQAGNTAAASNPTSPPPGSSLSPGSGSLGSKALDAWLSEEVCELQKREGKSWPVMLASVLEAAATTTPQMPHTKQHDDSAIARFAAVANLSLRHQLMLAVQLARSTMPRLQSAAAALIASQLSPPLLASVSSDNKNWAGTPEELLSDIAALVSAPAFPAAPEHKQQILQALGKLQSGDPRSRDAKQREEAAELAANLSAHANATSHVAEVLQDLGYSISSSIESLKDTLHPFPKLSEYDVARSEHKHARHRRVALQPHARMLTPCHVAACVFFVCFCAASS